jgi:hypothetical protein
MNYRWSEILSAESFTAAGTKVVDLDMSDPITRLSVLMKMTNNGSVPTDHPAKVLKKIELVDGSDVLASLSGMEAQALNFFGAGTQGYANLIYIDNVMAIIQFDLYFGRYLYDPDFALDTSKFKNPQLKISHDLSLGGSAPDALEIRVRADVFDGKSVSPQAFLMAKELMSYTLVASANQYIDLPTDFPVRMLMLMSRAGAKAPYEQFNQIKLSEEQDKKTILEGYTSDFQKVIEGNYPLWIDLIYGISAAAGRDHMITPTFDAYPSLTSEAVNEAIYQGAFTNGGTKKIYGASAGNFFGIFSGRCPHGALPIPMGNLNDPTDWWDVTQLANARLKITAGSSCDTTAPMVIVTQQARSY